MLQTYDCSGTILPKSMQTCVRHEQRKRISRTCLVLSCLTMAQGHATIVDQMRPGPCKAESSSKLSRAIIERLHVIVDSDSPRTSHRNAEQVHVIKRPLLGCNSVHRSITASITVISMRSLCHRLLSSVQVSVDFFSVNIYIVAIALYRCVGPAEASNDSATCR
jgi:hypothetical protein